MLNSNSYSYSKAYNNLKINAVSGTLVKSHSKSFMVSFNPQSIMGEKILSQNPAIAEHEYPYKLISVVVLQVLLTGIEKAEMVAEVVYLDDYLGVQIWLW